MVLIRAGYAPNYLNWYRKRKGDGKMTMLSETPMSAGNAILSKIGIEDKHVLPVAPPPVVPGSDHTTTVISRAELNSKLPSVYHLPFGLRMGKARYYTCVPTPNATNVSVETPIWRIELHGLGVHIEPLGFDVVGDAIIGRTCGSHIAHIDLEHFGAVDHGVSRRHAMLRPSRNKLYLLDLESTNGTFSNAMRVTSGMAQCLADGDTITLGNFSFEVKIIDWPGLRH
jgi:hypothetical protein